TRPSRDARDPSYAHADSQQAADRENQARVRSNRRRVHLLLMTSAAAPSLALGAVAGVVVAVFATAVAGAPVAAGVTVVVAALLVVALAHRSLVAALSVIGGRVLPDGEQPALANMVEGICATVGVERPELWLVEDPVPNACTLAASDGRCVLVVTSGLLASLGTIELEGVVAHELAHVKRYDAAVSAVAIATAGVLARMTGNDQLVHRAVGLGREYEADRVAVLAVRYPPGLHDALQRIRTAVHPSEDSVFAGGRWSATRWVWIDPMVGEREVAPIGELDATDVRMAALAEW
ncbi:MAG: M48 family metalloprotease, partial [Acidimicrobiales bacterium]